MPTSAEIRKWLADTGNSRQWLADELGAKKRSLDNWFTDDEFPEWAAKHIARIMRETQFPRLAFEEDDWDRLEHARALAGYKDRRSFFAEAIKAWADQIIAEKEGDNTNVIPIPPAGEPSKRIAEAPEKYSAPKKAPRRD